MTSPAVVSIRCLIDTEEVKRIDRGELMYVRHANEDAKNRTPTLPYLTRNRELSKANYDKRAVRILTAEAVTIYPGHRGEISVPVVVLGKTHVLMRRTGTQELTTPVYAAQALYTKFESNKTHITTDPTDAEFLGHAVHSASPKKTPSIDVVVNFARYS